MGNCCGCSDRILVVGGDTIDINNLTPTEIQNLFQRIINEGDQTQFEEFCAMISPLFTVSTGDDGDPANANQSATISCGQFLHLWSSDDTIDISVVDGSVIVDLKVSETVLNLIPANITFNANTLQMVNGNGDPIGTPIDLSIYIDDTNLARIVSGTVDNTTGVATFTRDDGTEFTLDLSNLVGTDTDTFGTVLTSEGVDPETTNGVLLNNGDSYILFPDGTTWATPNDDLTVCNSPVDRIVIDASLSTAGADAGSVAPNTGTINNSTGAITEPIADIQAWIDANINYATTTVVTGNDLQSPTPTSGQTDANWLEFYVVVDDAANNLLEWNTASEGYLKVEIAECSGEYVIGNQFHNAPPGATQTISNTLPLGVHKIRVTNVDVGGSESIWTFSGTATNWFTVSGEKPTANVVQLYVDCDGNYFEDSQGATPAGNSFALGEYPCVINNLITNTEGVDTDTDTNLILVDETCYKAPTNFVNFDAYANGTALPNVAPFNADPSITYDISTQTFDPITDALVATNDLVEIRRRGGADFSLRTPGVSENLRRVNTFKFSEPVMVRVGRQVNNNDGFAWEQSFVGWDTIGTDWVYTAGADAAAVTVGNKTIRPSNGVGFPTLYASTADWGFADSFSTEVSYTSWNREGFSIQISLPQTITSRTFRDVLTNELRHFWSVNGSDTITEFDGVPLPEWVDECDVNASQVNVGDFGDNFPVEVTNVEEALSWLAENAGGNTTVSLPSAFMTSFSNILISQPVTVSLQNVDQTAGTFVETAQTIEDAGFTWNGGANGVSVDEAGTYEISMFIRATPVSILGSTINLNGELTATNKGTIGHSDPQNLAVGEVGRWSQTVIVNLDANDTVNLGIGGASVSNTAEIQGWNLGIRKIG